MSEDGIGRRDWLKLGGLGGAAAILGGCSNKLGIESAPVTGIIFMVSDGMSQGVLSMAESFSQQVRSKGTRWWSLIDDKKSVRGLMETSSANSMVTDSAAASSAWGGGVKINNRSVNIRPDGSESVPIMRHLKRLGLRTGLVTTTTITHATPAGFAAVCADRDEEHLIAPQYAGVVDVLLGGGMKFFDQAQRVDSRDALGLFTKAGYKFIQTRDELLQTKSNAILGLFQNEHMPFEVDRRNSLQLRQSIPTLAEMSDVAVKNMIRSKQRFLLQIEGGRIDHGAHANDIAALLWDQLAFDEALEKVLQVTEGRDDILIIVTSDHGNANPGMNGTGKEYADTNKAFQSIARMSASYEKIFSDWKRVALVGPDYLFSLIEERLGFSLSGEETKTLFASLIEEPVVEWSNQMNSPLGLLGQFAGNHTGIGWTGTSHTSDPTMISAIGPQAERFSGIVPNQEVHRHFMEILG